MNRTTERLAHAFAVRGMRRIGRKLMTGEYSSELNAEPLSAEEAVTVMVRAASMVMRLGLQSVIDAASESLERVVRSMLGE